MFTFFSEIFLENAFVELCSNGLIGFGFNGVLDAAKWTPHTYGATSVGTVSISNSKLIINGVEGARFGVLSQQINEKTADVTIKVELSGYSGANAMVSLNAQAGSTMDNNIEFGIDAGKLATCTFETSELTSPHPGGD